MRHRSGYLDPRPSRLGLTLVEMPPPATDHTCCQESQVAKSQAGLGFWLVALAPGLATPPPRREPGGTRAGSFDHLVGASEQGRRDIDAERLGGLEVDE